MGFRISMTSVITKFLDWYEKHMAKSLIISAVILYAQIPHTITAAECFFGDYVFTLIYGKNIVLDFIIYGIDLLELIPIIGITIAIVSKVRHRVA